MEILWKTTWQLCSRIVGRIVSNFQTIYLRLCKQWKGRGISTEAIIFNFIVKIPFPFTYNLVGANCRIYKNKVTYFWEVRYSFGFFPRHSDKCSPSYGRLLSLLLQIAAGRCTENPRMFPSYPDDGMQVTVQILQW